jgi:hypothetical protein
MSFVYNNVLSFIRKLSTKHLAVTNGCVVETQIRRIDLFWRLQTALKDCGMLS